MEWGADLRVSSPKDHELEGQDVTYMAVHGLLNMNRDVGDWLMVDVLDGTVTLVEDCVGVDMSRMAPMDIDMYTDMDMDGIVVGDEHMGVHMDADGWVEEGGHMSIVDRTAEVVHRAAVEQVGKRERAHEDKPQRTLVVRPYNRWEDDRPECSMKVHRSE